ncbi:helix-turn-helix domain-containing protein [Saccharopolyspora sp. K220]|uniref:IclR family transcriptional regulator n=1 Tax=Saccharopolyspora soli TaxID=2926618 RepID=UPI001F599B58|nr:helix-turn-helix domain-containing protein [Saccharopolyspora soli]MCI2417804.1 helix-turn-helix domain-containing protein [Saccharopolyspora soli]
MEQSDFAPPRHGSSARDELDRSVSQTLSRGLQVLEVLAAEGRPLTAQQIATALGLSRPVVYRLLRTLAQHHLLSTEVGNGRYDLGLGLLTLSRSVQRDLRHAAFPIIRSLAQELNTTAVLGLRDGDEVVYVLAVEAEFARMAVRSREGTRRPLQASTSGLALRLTFEPSPDDDAELRQARAAGFAARDVVMGYQATAISAPVPSEAGPSEACVTVLFPNVIDDIEDRAPLVVDAAERIAGVVRI